MQKPSWAYCSWIWSTGHSLLTPDPCTSEIRFPMKLQSFLITSKFFWLWRTSALSQLAFQTPWLFRTPLDYSSSVPSATMGAHLSNHPIPSLPRDANQWHRSLTSRASTASYITVLPFFGLEIHKRSEFCRFFTYTFTLISQLKWGRGKKWDMERIYCKLILNSDYLQIPKCIFDEQDKLWSIFVDSQYHTWANSTAWSLHALESIFSDELQQPGPTAKWFISYCWEPDFVQRCHLLLQVFTKSPWAWALSLGLPIWFHSESGDYWVSFSVLSH